MYGSTVGFNVVVSRQPVEAADAAEPRHRAAAGQPAAGRGADRSTAWVNDPAARDKLTDALAEALDAEGITLEAMSYTGSTVDVRIINRRISQTPKAIGRTARDAGGRHARTRSRPSASPRWRTGCRPPRSTIDRSDSRRRSTGRTRAWRAGRRSGSRARCRCSRRATTWRRDVYPLVDWAVIPVPTVQLFGGNDGFRPQLDRRVPRQRHASRPGCRSRTTDPPADPRRVRRSGRRPEYSGNAAAGAQRLGALLRRLGAEAGPADRRLPVQAEPRHLCPRVRRHPRARVRRRRRRGAVEAGRAELGPRRRAQLRGAARLRQPVRLRLLRLRRGDRARLALLGHRLVRDRGAALPPAATSPATGAARCARDRGASPTAGRSAPTPPRPTSRPRTSARAASTRA